MDTTHQTRTHGHRSEVSEGGSVKMEAPAHNATGGVEDTGRRFSWRTLAVILAVAGPTSLLLIPYSMTLLGQGDGTEIPPCGYAWSAS